MKSKLLKPFFVAIGCASFSTTLFANQITLFNASPEAHSLEITYRIAYKNPGQAPVFSEIKTLNCSNDAVISFEMKGYERAGIVPVAIAGRSLPADANQFDQPHQCTLATDKTHPNGLMVVKLIKQFGGQGNISCETHGGVL